jgi:uncharacterized membrane protein
MSFGREFKKEKTSIIGSIISFGGVIYNKFVPTKFTLASQSVFGSASESGALYISLGVLSIILLAIFLTIGVVRAHHRHKRSR